MIRLTNYGVWVEDNGELNKNEIAIYYILECAKLAGVKVIKGKTTLDMQFMAEVMKGLRSHISCKGCVREDNRELEEFCHCCSRIGTDKYEAKDDIDRECNTCIHRNGCYICDSCVDGSKYIGEIKYDK